MGCKLVFPILFFAAMLSASFAENSDDDVGSGSDAAFAVDNEAIVATDDVGSGLDVEFTIGNETVVSTDDDVGSGSDAAFAVDDEAVVSSDEDVGSGQEETDVSANEPSEERSEDDAILESSGEEDSSEDAAQEGSGAKEYLSDGEYIQSTIYYLEAQLATVEHGPHYYMDQVSCVDSHWGADHFIVRDPSDCARYARCRNQVRHITSCPPGQWINEKGVCEAKEKVTCVDAAPSNPNENWQRAIILDKDYDPNSLNGFDSDFLCPFETERELHYPIDGNCFWFAICKGVDRILRKCAGGTVFSAKYRRCERPRDADREGCGVKELIKGVDCNLRKYEGVYGDHGRFPHPDDCRKFYYCDSERQPVEAACDVQLRHVFDEGEQLCRYYKQVEKCNTYYDDVYR